MYKTTSDRQHDISRTGSHATKPLATGRVDVLPPGADPWAAIFNDIRAQRQIASENYEIAVRQLQDVDWQIRMSSDGREQFGLLKKREAIIARRDQTGRILADLRIEIIHAARSSMAERFRSSAWHMLHSEQFIAISQAAKDLMKDADPDIAKFAGARLAPRNRKHNITAAKENGASPEKLEQMRERSRNRDKLKRLRARLLIK
jgi:hypothetical protein